MVQLLDRLCAYAFAALEDLFSPRGSDISWPPQYCIQVAHRHMLKNGLFLAHKQSKKLKTYTEKVSELILKGKMRL